jgi:uncharacterized RmlC-like cupin family protein
MARRAGKLNHVAAEPIRKVAPEERVPGAVTPGMNREEAFNTGDVWAGFVRTDVGMMSGWHHHGEHDSVIYVLSGSMRMESGPGGADVLEAGPGDFLHVPAGAVHRESNPAGEEARIVVFRSGTGPVVINVDGPDSAS